MEITRPNRYWSTEVLIKANATQDWPVCLLPLTFGAPDPHDGLKSDLSGKVSLEILLEFLSLRCIVNVMEGRVVEDTAGGVFGHTRCTRRKKDLISKL